MAEGLPVMYDLPVMLLTSAIDAESASAGVALLLFILVFFRDVFMFIVS